MMAKKFYVVWVGRETGIFTDWAKTKKQVDQFPGAKYKSFKTAEEAEQAFSHKPALIKSTTPRKRIKEKSANNSPVISSRFDVTVYCDGACDPNPGKAGSGVAIYQGDALTELWYGLFTPNGTNNSAELNALYQSLLIAKKQMSLGKTVQIRCDSQYSIKCISEWAFGWELKGWKRKTAGDIKNLEIIQRAHALYKTLKEEIVISHVKAHAGIEGNELADRMALFGVVQQAEDFRQYSDSLDVEQILKFDAG